MVSGRGYHVRFAMLAACGSGNDDALTAQDKTTAKALLQLRTTTSHALSLARPQTEQASYMLSCSV